MNEISQQDFYDKIETIKAKVNYVQNPSQSPLKSKEMFLMEIGKEVWDMAVSGWFYAHTAHRIMEDIYNYIYGDISENPVNKERISGYINDDGIAMIEGW